MYICTPNLFPFSEIISAFWSKRLFFKEPSPGQQDYGPCLGKKWELQPSVLSVSASNSLGVSPSSPLTLIFLF